MTNVTVGSPFASASTTVNLGQTKPNVLLIILDDVGVDVLRSYQAFHTSYLGYTLPPPPDTGGEVTGYPRTDEIALIAQNGVKFYNFRVMPNCSPTRAQVYTSRYGVRTGVGTVIREDLTGDLDEFSDAYSREVHSHRWMRPAGYRTLLCGKYHLALPNADMTPDQGVVGTLGWDHPTAPTVDVGTFRGTFRNVNKSPMPPATTTGINPGHWNFHWYESDADDLTLEPQAVTSYSTAWSRQRLQQWINFGGPEPWMAVWALNAAHAPFGPQNAANFSGCMPPDDSSHVYAPGIYNANTVWGSVRAAIECVDKMIGTLRTNIGTGVWDRTWVFFMSDNGTDEAIIANGVTVGENFGSYYTSQTGRFKNSVYASGTRGCLLVKGPTTASGLPGIISPNRISHVLVDAVDIPETIRQITTSDRTSAVSDSRSFDGRSFYNALRNLDSFCPRAAVGGFSFAEVFEPNGDPSDITTTSGGNKKDRSYWKQRADGKWSLVRRLVGSSNQHQLYHLTDATNVNVDSRETTDLSVSQEEINVEMQQDLTAFLVSCQGDQGV